MTSISDRLGNSTQLLPGAQGRMSQMPVETLILPPRRAFTRTLTYCIQG